MDKRDESHHFVSAAGGTMHTGATVDLRYSRRRFEVDLSVEPHFLVDPTLIVSNSEKTAGAANRRKIHEYLDQFLDECIKRARS